LILGYPTRGLGSEEAVFYLSIAEIYGDVQTAVSRVPNYLPQTTDRIGFEKFRKYKKEYASMDRNMAAN
jgi:hypothetical protein